MIKSFEKGKYYVWDCKDKAVENNSISIYFNKNMIKWFDRKPRKCRSVYEGCYASFENLVNYDMWDYAKAMQYFKEFIRVKQEEMDI